MKRTLITIIDYSIHGMDILACGLMFSGAFLMEATHAVAHCAAQYLKD